jgi:MraZ protein
MTYELSGAYTCTLDNKGRLRMPSELLRQFGEQAGRKFIVNRALDNSLVLYPMDVWAEEKAKIRAKIDPFNAAHRRFEMIYVQGAEEVEMDGQDRLLLQKRFVEFAKLEKELVLATQYDKVQIWDKAAYDAIFNISADELSNLAFEVMGNKD